MARVRPLPHSVEPPSVREEARRDLESRSQPAAAPDSSRARAITLLRWTLVAVFIGAGTAKLVSMPSMVTLFAAVGFGQWFRYAVGAWELLGAVLLMRRQTTFLGVAALTVLMIGAGGTEVITLNRPPLSSAGTLLALLLLGLSARQRERRAA